MTRPSFKPVADHGLLVELATEVSDGVSAQIVALDQLIIEANIDGVQELVPALVNLMVIFDPIVTDHRTVQSAVEKLFPLDSSSRSNGTHHQIPVCYDDGFCPDMHAVCDATGLSPADVIAAHTNTTVKVGMYGFAPGYAYLTEVDKRLQLPRKTTPVRDVPAGSVMVAGPQCLITTMIMPAGWWVIGRTAAQIIREDSDKQFLFDVGDTVSFVQTGSEGLE